MNSSTFAFYARVGPLALGTRLRSLSARLYEGVTRVYSEDGVNFNPRWFPVFFLLAEESPRPVTEMGQAIGQSHAAVSQVLKAMLAEGLVERVAKGNDGRVRNFGLTKAGRSLAVTIQDQFSDIRAAASELLGESEHDLWRALDDLEERLEERDFFGRVCAQRQAPDQAPDQASDQVQARARNPAFEDAPAVATVRIEPFRDGDGEAFAELNREWIEEHFEMESKDRQILYNPEEEILKKGGSIFVARAGDEVVGVCALITREGAMPELAKMAVSKQARGQGLGRKLGMAILDEAKAKGAKQVFLDSSTKLRPAIALYKSLGFRTVIGQRSPYSRGDIRMQVDL